MPTDNEDQAAKRRLGDFDIIREIGRGGMGVVYEAHQRSLNRKVALKVLESALGLPPHAVDRFRREAEAAAKLHHGNIVPVYATGECDGVHFYAMELITGPSLDLVIRQLRLHTSGVSATPEAPTPELVATAPHVPGGLSHPASGVSAPLGSGSGYFDSVARLIADVAEALDHAHQHGVIHRDVKPSNLLLSSDGRLSVNDFGLARILEQPGMTMPGEFVGTPAYVSPEQITAGRVPLDHRTDVYSLGATLYELLTLQPPFSGASRDQVLAQIIQKEPRRPRQIDGKIPRDLETICLKCLEKDPDRRYRTAKDLADDLRRFVNRFAIQARRAGPFTRLTKWVKRNPALGAATLVIVLAVGAACYFAWHVQENNRVLREQKQRAAIDKGMVAAMAADPRTARAAIAEAETLGTSAGELHLLRGFVALYSGDPTGAIKEFRTAAEAMPDSVAARALLAAAHGQAGDWEASDLAMKEAEKHTVRTPEDRLFLGLALSPFDSAASVKELRAAVSDRPSNLGYILLADALCMHAGATGTISDCEVALEAANTASRWLPGNPYLEVIGVNARLAAAKACELANQPREAERHVEEASRLADTLSGPRGSAPVISARFCVAEHRDGIGPRLPFTRKLWFPTRSDEPDVIRTEVVVLWRLGEIARARSRLDSMSPSTDTTPLRVALALEQANGRGAARAVWADSAGSDRGSFNLMQMLPWLYLTGESDRVPAMAAKLRKSGFRYRGIVAAEWDTMLRYCEGKMRETDLLASPASQRSINVWRNMIIGMKQLGEGDRKGARQAFLAAHRLRAYSGEAEWIHSFLIRMNTDPEWPRAIPMKNGS